jgi:hypothetical protein
MARAQRGKNFSGLGVHFLRGFGWFILSLSPLAFFSWHLTHAQMEIGSCHGPRNSRGAIVIIGSRSGGELTRAYYASRLGCAYERLVFDRSDIREARMQVPYPTEASEIEEKTGATSVAALIVKAESDSDARRELFNLQSQARQREVDRRSAQNNTEVAETLARVRSLLHESNAVDIFIAAHTNEHFLFLDQLNSEERSKIRLVYNSGCTDFQDRSEWLSRGAKIYLGHDSTMSCSPGFLHAFLDSWLSGESLADAINRGNKMLSYHLGTLRYILDPLGIACTELAKKHYATREDYLASVPGQAASAKGVPPLSRIRISSIPPRCQGDDLARGGAMGGTVSERHTPAEKHEGSLPVQLERPSGEKNLTSSQQAL